MLNKELAKTTLGQQILEEEKQKKEDARLASLPKPPPPQPPSPKFKTVMKVRAQFPPKQTYSRKKPVYTGIGNDVYHTYDYFKVQVPDGPTAEELKQQDLEAKEAIARQVDQEIAERNAKKKKPRFDPKLNKIKELDRKVQAALNNEKGKVAQKMGYKKPLFERDRKTALATSEPGSVIKPVTMSGFSMTSKQDEMGNRRLASVTQYLKNLDTQLMTMQKTDEVLIAKLKQAELDRKEIERRHEINRAYQDKLAAIKKEEQRHLRAAKKVPASYEHKYAMDLITEQLIQDNNRNSDDKNQQRIEGVDDLRSIDSSPAREMAYDGGMGTQTDFKVVIEEPVDSEPAVSEKSGLKTQTIEENYKETVQLVKKYIRVEVPNLGVNESARTSLVKTPIADQSLN